MTNNKILTVVDTSYFCYYIIFGAVNEFVKRYSDDAKHWIKPAEEVDQQNLPNLLNCDSFRRVLKKMTMRRCEVIDRVMRQNFQDDIDAADRIDIIFAMDDRVSNSFRKRLYPDYKAQRALTPKQFQIQPIKDYIINVIFKDLNVEEEHGYKIVKVDGAEGDDVIACIMRNYNDYMLKILFASDKDFLQLDNVRQFGLDGKEVLRKVDKEILSPNDFLLYKIIVGDGSDNIPKVFERVGCKKALKLIHDKDKLRADLKEKQDSAKRFMLNKKLISFAEMPNELVSTILEKVNEKMFEIENASRTDFDFADFMNM